MGDKAEFPSISFRLRSTIKSSEIMTSSFPAGGVFSGISHPILKEEAAKATRDVIFAYINPEQQTLKTQMVFNNHL